MKTISQSRGCIFRMRFIFGFLMTLGLCLRAQNFAEVDRIMDEMRQTLGAGATLVVQQNGATVYSRSTGDWSATRATSIASASKWLSGALLMTVVDAGEISLNDTVDRYLPEFTGPSGKATVRQLFSMTSGFGVNEPACVMDRSTTLEACARQIAGVSLALPPGTGFIYGSTGMQLAARIAEVATGKRWADLMRERLTGPLGMTSTRVSLLSADGNPLVAGGYVSSAQDYQRFLNMVLNGGVFEGRRILSSRAVDEMLADQTAGARIVASPYAQFDLTQPGAGATRYGIGNWRQTVTNGVLEESSSTGAFGFTPWVDFTRNLTGALSILNDNPNVFPFYRRIRDALRRQIPAAKLVRRGVTNAANYSAGRVVPGQICTIFGDGIGPEQLVVTDFAGGRVPLVLGGTRVTVGGVEAPIFVAARNQLSVIVPFELAGRVSAELKVNALPGIVVPVEPSDPGLFTLSQDGNGLAAAVNVPASAGQVVLFYATGLGQTDPAGVTGGIAGATLKRVAGGVRVEIDGRQAEVLYAGTAPGLIEGLTQLNVLVPVGVRTGMVRVRLSVDGVVGSGDAMLQIR